MRFYGVDTRIVVNAVGHMSRPHRLRRFEVTDGMNVAGVVVVTGAGEVKGHDSVTVIYGALLLRDGASVAALTEALEPLGFIVDVDASMYSSTRWSQWKGYAGLFATKTAKAVAKGSSLLDTLLAGRAAPVTRVPRKR